MTTFNYADPAELFAARNRNSRSFVRYYRFETAAEALRFAIEDLPAPMLAGAVLEVGDERFNPKQMLELYRERPADRSRPSPPRASL